MVGALIINNMKMSYSEYSYSTRYQVKSLCLVFGIDGISCRKSSGVHAPVLGLSILPQAALYWMCQKSRGREDVALGSDVLYQGLWKSFLAHPEASLAITQ